MTKRTLRQAFNAVFHKGESFEEFCRLELAGEVDEFEIEDRRVIRPKDKLKKYLRFLDKVVMRNLSKDEEVVHSFVKGKSTLTAVLPHVNNKYFFLTDVRNFYPSISPSDVRKILLRDKDTIPIADIESHIDLIVRMTTYGNSLPVGFPTSPQISNAFLLGFDREIKKYCVSNDLVYTRYADDLIVSGKSFEQLADLRAVVQDYLKKYASPSLMVKERKTRITQFGNKVKILGLVILPNGRITIDSKYKDKIETLLHFYVNDKEKYHSFLEEEFRGSEHSVFGLLHYAKSIDPKYLDKLQRKYGVYSVKSLMEDKWSDRR